MDKAARRRRLRGVLSGLALELAPQAAAIAAFLAGVVLLLSAATHQGVSPVIEALRTTIEQAKKASS